MKESFKKSAVWAFGIVSAIFTFVPESFFQVVKWVPVQAMQKSVLESGITDIAVDIVISRVVVFAAIWFGTALAYNIYRVKRKSIKIKGANYTIQIKYGNLLKEKKCKKVINFDECFTTHIGTNPCDVKKTSICGQYLSQDGKNLNIQQLLSNVQIKPEERISRYDGKTSYKPGSIIAIGDYLLLAFATLDENGRARFFSLDEFVECLLTMWKQIEVNCTQQDVCIPILGSGLTNFEGGNGASLSQQELLNLIVWSYKLSPHKIKAPYKLRIICQKRDGFSFNDIDGL